MEEHNELQNIHIHTGEEQRRNMKSLYDTLFWHINNHHIEHEQPVLSWDDVVQAAVADDMFSEAALVYLSPNGAGYQIDEERADSSRDRLLRDMVKALKQQCSELKSTIASK